MDAATPEGTSAADELAPETQAAPDEQAAPAMLDFSGEYTHSLDVKGRLTIPACFRDVLASGMEITRGLGEYISVYSLNGWAELSAKIKQLPQYDERAEAFRHMVQAGAVNVVPDGMGRILLPEYLRQHAKIDGQATIVGAGSKLEIWNPEAWRAVLAEHYKQDIKKVKAALSAWGI